jgi:hypothetical protein
MAAFFKLKPRLASQGFNSSAPRATRKSLILLHSLELGGNPSLSAKSAA